MRGSVAALLCLHTGCLLRKTLGDKKRAAEDVFHSGHAQKWIHISVIAIGAV